MYREKQWEYMTESWLHLEFQHEPCIEAFSGFMDRHGKNGWEAYQITEGRSSDIVYFKRELNPY